MATNFLNDDIYYQQREDPFELFNNRRIVAPDTKRKETNHRNLIELEKDDDVMIIDDDIKEDRALPKSNPKTETNKEATTTKQPATTTTTTTASLDEDEKMARKMQEEYDRELAEEFNRRENRIRAFNRPNAISSSSRFNRNYADSPLFPVPINEDSEDNSVLVDMSRPINSYNRSSLREHATQFRRAEPTAPVATNSSSTSRIGASTITPNNATNSTSRIPPSIQDDLMNSIARSSNQSNNQSNSNNNGVATTSNDASRRGYQPFDRNSAMMTGARRSGSANHSSAMAATASWISSLPSNNPNTNADPVNNLASAFSILNDDEIVSGFMGDMRLQQPNHSNHRISQFQPNNHQHHNHQMPPNLHPSLHRRQRFTNNLNRAEFMPHSRAPASSIALRVAMNNRDFTPDDYETLLRLDEINQVKKVLSKEEIESLPCFSYKQSDAAAAASGAGSDKSCSICYEDYVSREKIMALACTHKFHKKCIQKWLQESRRCPLCQKDAVSGE